MQCVKQFSLTVDELNVLFDWPAASLAGDATFTPELTTGNTAVSFSNGNLGTGFANSDNTGEFIWNSTAILPVNMHVEAVSTGSNPDPIITASLGVSVVAPATSLLFIQAGVDFNYNDVVDFPFNLPDTGGADWTMRWNHQTLVSPNPNNAGTMQLTGILTVI